MDAPTTRVHHEGIFKKRLCIPGERLTNPVNHQAIRNLQQFLPDGRLAFIGADQRLQIQEDGVFRASATPWNTWISSSLGAHGTGWLVLAYGTPGGLCDLKIDHGVPVLSPLPVELDGVAVAVHDGLRLSEDAVLLATDRGLCRYALEKGVCSTLSPRGLNEVPRHLVRDREGRVWMAGRGLYWLAAPDQAIAVTPFLPFLNDAKIEHLSVSAGRLAVALGSRGLVFLDLSATVAALH